MVIIYSLVNCLLIQMGSIRGLSIPGHFNVVLIVCTCVLLRVVLGVCVPAEFLQDSGPCSVSPVSGCGLVRVHLLQHEPRPFPLCCVCSYG